MIAACLKLPAAIAATVLLIVASGCKTGAPPGDDAQSSAAHPVLAVTVAQAHVAPIESVIKVLGTTVALRHVSIRAPSAGQVVDLTLKDGDVVRKGQVIARIVNRESQAAHAGLEVARRLDPAEASKLAQSVDRYADLRGIPVIAPEGGVVDQQPVTSGQIVGDLDPLLDMVDPASIFVEAAVPVSDYHLIEPGMAATVTSPLRPEVEYRARVAALIPEFTANSATSPVRLEFVGPQTISDVGAPCEARIVTKSVPDALVIPVAALFQEGNSYHVFEVGGDHRAHRTPVTIGIRNARVAQIVSGLSVGAVVITSGGYALSDGLDVQVIGAAQ